MLPKLDWIAIKDKYSSNPVSHTKNGKPFRIWRITEDTIFIALPAHEQGVSRVNLQRAVDLINQGTVIAGPADYKRLVCDERPAYAWGILKDFSFV